MVEDQTKTRTRTKERMGQDRACSPGDPISIIPAHECVVLCPLFCGVLHYRPRTRPLEAYCHSCSLVISVRSFGIHPRLFTFSYTKYTKR
ncbi:hypothetical protein AVEN_260472-1 [Araneus ventricosus]|uniref:Uncharacterized protein n=1 Tax=Araneus ventricosus TaxID=182803 RepID=A0A4Y2TSB2_ARAVE|nr:hypothetical protein AVEN_260472-1 [Araneus ventricosus]